jgi:hypothetical protein
MTWGRPTREVVREVVRGVECRREGERPLSRIPRNFVINVVEDQAVEIQRAQAGDGGVGNLLHAFALGGRARWRQRKQQELTCAAVDAAHKIHGQDRSRARASATRAAGD